MVNSWQILMTNCIAERIINETKSFVVELFCNLVELIIGSIMNKTFFCAISIYHYSPLPYYLYEWV